MGLEEKLPSGVLLTKLNPLWFLAAGGALGGALL